MEDILKANLGGSGWLFSNYPGPEHSISNSKHLESEYTLKNFFLFSTVDINVYNGFSGISYCEVVL